MHRWEDVEQMLRTIAEVDLSAGEERARPCLVGFGGAQPRFAAFLRPFEKGGYQDPIVELLALAGPLDCDRLAFAATARAWSLDDPIAPVTGDADLRQRVLMIELVDGTSSEVGHRSVLVPFDDPAPGQPVRWGEPMELPGGEGWISGVLKLAVGPLMRARLRVSDAEAAAQARRIDRLGHELHLAPDVVERFAHAPVVSPRLQPRRCRR